MPDKCSFLIHEERIEEKYIGLGRKREARDEPIETKASRDLISKGFGDLRVADAEGTRRVDRTHTYYH